MQRISRELHPVPVEKCQKLERLQRITRRLAYALAALFAGGNPDQEQGEIAARVLPMPVIAGADATCDDMLVEPRRVADAVRFAPEVFHCFKTPRSLDGVLDGIVERIAWMRSVAPMRFGVQIRPALHQQPHDVVPARPRSHHQCRHAARPRVIAFKAGRRFVEGRVEIASLRDPGLHELKVPGHGGPADQQEADHQHGEDGKDDDDDES